MRISRVSCDVCGAVVTLDVSQIGSLHQDGDLPDDWMRFEINGARTPAPAPHAPRLVPSIQPPRNTVRTLGELVGGPAGAAQLEAAMQADAVEIDDEMARSERAYMGDHDADRVVHVHARVDACAACVANAAGVHAALVARAEENVEREARMYGGFVQRARRGKIIAEPQE